VRVDSQNFGQDRTPTPPPHPAPPCLPCPLLSLRIYVSTYQPRRLLLLSPTGNRQHWDQRMPCTHWTPPTKPGTDHTPHHCVTLHCIDHHHGLQMRTPFFRRWLDGSHCLRHHDDIAPWFQLSADSISRDDATPAFCLPLRAALHDQHTIIANLLPTTRLLSLNPYFIVIAKFTRPYFWATIMSHSWLQRKRKGELIELAQKAGLSEYVVVNDS
jgi:hypothetical protein